MPLKHILNFWRFTTASHQHTSFHRLVFSKQRKIKNCLCCQISQQVDDFFEHARLRNTQRCTFCPSKNLHLAFFPPFSSFELSLMPDSGKKSTAPNRGKGPEWLTGGGGMDNNAAFLSPGAPASQFWLRIHLASAFHQPQSARPSPKRCAMVQYRATLERVKLPARANEISIYT